MDNGHDSFQILVDPCEHFAVKPSQWRLPFPAVLLNIPGELLQTPRFFGDKIGSLH
jgi:hypothetical protein